jgi:hypothetical protein
MSLYRLFDAVTFTLRELKQKQSVTEKGPLAFFKKYIITVNNRTRKEEEREREKGGKIKSFPIRSSRLREKKVGGSRFKKRK